MAGSTAITAALARSPRARPKPPNRIITPRYEGWRTNLYGPLVTTACSCRTTTVVVKSRPRVSTAHSRRSIPAQATVSPAITHKTGSGRLRVWCNASTSPAANPPTIPAVMEK
jgi:hypothetical protein